MSKQVSVAHLDAFITRVWVFDLSEELLASKKRWLDIITEMRQQLPNPQGRSNRQGWNSEKIIFNNPEFKILNQLSKVCFRHAFKELALKDHDTMSFGLEAWANTHDPGGYNTKHMHARVMLSGCFYLDVPDGSGQIIFTDPRPGAMHTMYQSYNELGGNNLVLTPKQGQLVVFPNYLEHYVETNESESVRVSIAMNARRTKNSN